MDDDQRVTQPNETLSVKAPEAMIERVGYRLASGAETPAFQIRCGWLVMGSGLRLRLDEVRNYRDNHGTVAFAWRTGTQEVMRLPTPEDAEKLVAALDKHFFDDADVL
jgi:hypothetical protein